MRSFVRAAAAGIAWLLAGCASSSVGGGSFSVATKAPSVQHAIVGFSVDTPARAAIAARQGIQTTILYGNVPAERSALSTALRRYGIGIIDGGISSELQYWECHRTHTVKPPPNGSNDYCNTDENPRVRSEAVVLHDVGELLTRDARRPDVAGFWVLDDWPYWDPGSGRRLLQKIHALIVTADAGKPAVCGFGAGLARPGRVAWDPGTASNYSKDGCDEVGWYVYSPFGRRHRSNGDRLDWSMKALLPAMGKSLAKYGWSLARAPLLGIGQAWSGRYASRNYQPGLSTEQMRAQAGGFCAFGATSIAWYAWDDSGFDRDAQTPENSTAISNGIAAGIDACNQRWRGTTTFTITRSF